MLPDEASSDALGVRLAPMLGVGDILALCGQIGAGKSHLARAIIASRLDATGDREEIPSPTFTLVQTYRAGDLEIWHCDLFRLDDPEEVWELGLEEAFDTALCLIEWADRLGNALPEAALRLDLAPGAWGSGRSLRLTGSAERWGERLRHLVSGEVAVDD